MSDHRITNPISTLGGRPGVLRRLLLAFMVAALVAAATIAAVAATYEAETTYIARGLGISFTTESVSRLYGRPGIVYVPIRNRTSYIGLVWNPAELSPQASALVSHVEAEWEFAEGQGVERPASYH